MADYSVVQLLFFQFFLILLNAVFACAEIAVISINDNKLKMMADSGNKQAKKLVSLTAQPAKFLATIQIGITFAGFLGSAFAADNFSDRIVDWLVEAGVTISPKTLDVLAVIGITLILSYVTLVLGELVPKRIAMNYAEKIGLGLSGTLYIIAKLFSPLVWLLTVSTNAVLYLFRINPEEKNDTVTEEEIRMMVEAGNQNGTIDDIEKDFIHNLFEFDDKTAEDVMTHRTDVTFLDFDDTKENWEKIITDTRYSIYPIYKNDRDNIIGTLAIKDYFKFKSLSKEKVIAEAVRPAQFISKSKHIDQLFKSMQKSRNYFAVVVDEYGGVFGVVTMTDLLEELVGDLEDDMTAPPSIPLINKVSNGLFVIQGSAPIEDVALCLQLDIKDEEYDYGTFAGFLLEIMGGFPEDKKNRKFIHRHLKIKISKMRGHRIEEAIVQILEKQQTEEDN